MGKRLSPERLAELKKKMDDGCFPMSAIPELLADREVLVQAMEYMATELAVKVRGHGWDVRKSVVRDIVSEYIEAVDDEEEE